MKNLLYLISLLAIVSCKSEPKFDPELLINSWIGQEWKVQGKTATDRDASSVNFVFEKQLDDAKQGRYVAAYGNQKEQGAYQIKGDKLYTTADDNKIEKVVRIVELSADKLVLDMNRGGVAEELVLIKK